MIKQQLERYFRFSEFKEGQEEIIESILKRQDTVAVMPTGGGKSLCYQLPSVMNENMTIVISPLIALMKDQVDTLKAQRIPAAYLNSSQSYQEVMAVEEQIRAGQIKLLYVAPERLTNMKFGMLFLDIAVDLIAIDEAHCVSSWGHDFRPQYMMIKRFINQFNQRPTVAAFTATATPEVRADIIANLGLESPALFIRGFDRPNLTFSVQGGLTKDEPLQYCAAIVEQAEGSGIIYCLTRKKTEEVAKYFDQKGIKAIAYHAGLSAEVRNRVQQQFMENQYKVIVATVAFGMGVNKADIRFVIHYGMPATMENYYQEAGRAGRDGEPASCYLLASKRDMGLHSFFIKNSQEEMIQQGKPDEVIKQVINIKYNKLSQMKSYVDEKKCRRQMILQYFSDTAIVDNCQACDVCLDLPSVVTPDANDLVYDDGTVKTKRPRVRKPRSKQGKGTTVEQTVKLFQEDYRIEQIAKIRGLGQRTVFDHLISWYASGGSFPVEDFLPSEVEDVIRAAINQVGSKEKLSPIKKILPRGISYEQIKLVLVKMDLEA